MRIRQHHRHLLRVTTESAWLTGPPDEKPAGLETFWQTCSCRAMLPQRADNRAEIDAMWKDHLRQTKAADR